jgi:hypothetical protein
MKLPNYRITLLVILAYALFPGCVQDGADDKADICKEPYARINGSCCLDDNANGVCDRMEISTTKKQPTTTVPAASTTSPASSTTQRAVNTTVSTFDITSTTTTLKQCTSASDCGQAYYGSCGCKGNNVTRTSYTPICTRGTCKYKSDTEILRCYRNLDTDGDDTVSSERCVPGYMNCIIRDDYESFFTIPDDAKMLQNLTADGFLEGYNGYRFRMNRVEYPQEMRCFDDMTFYMDIMDPDGTVIIAEYAWNKTAEYGDYELGLARINTVNGSFNPVAWVRRT